MYMLTKKDFESYFQNLKNNYLIVFNGCPIYFSGLNN